MVEPNFLTAQDPKHPKTQPQTTLRLMPRDVAPYGTFDKLPFDQLMAHYDRSK